MTRWLVVLAVCVVAVGCETPRPAGACGGEVCGEGQVCDRDQQRCVTDEPPSVTAQGPGGVVTTMSFSVTGTARDDVAVTRLEWSLDGQGWSDATLAADGSFRVDVPSRSGDLGPQTVVVRASDARSQATAQVVVQVDRAGPTLEVLPVDGGVYRSPTGPLTVIARDGSGQVVAVSVAGTPVTPTPANGAAATVQVPVPAGLDGETFEVELSAADPYGNVTTQVARLLSDEVPPQLAPTIPSVLTTSPTRLTAVATDPTEPLEVFFATDAGVFAATRDPAGDGGQWYLDLPVAQVEAPLDVVVTALDGAGNRAEVSRAVAIDRLAPTVSITAPATGLITRQAFTVTATTTGTTSAVTARLGTETPVAMTGGAGTWTATLPVSAGDFRALDVVVTATDGAGNAGTDQRGVSVDTVAPQLAFTAPAANRRFNIADFAAGPNVNVSWTVTDGDAQAATTSVNGLASTATSAIVVTQATFDGDTVTTTVTAADRAGNTAAASLAFTVDRVAPTVTAWEPAHNARNTDAGTFVSFSEAVVGATTATDALTLTPAPGAGTWNGAHTRWDSAALTPYTVYDAALATLADDHGNPVATASARRFHVQAAAFTPVAALASSVLEVRAAADPDGVVTVAYKTSNPANMGQTTFAVQELSPRTLTLGTALRSETTNLGGFGLNVWSQVDGTTLVGARDVAVAWQLTGTSPQTNRTVLQSDGGIVSISPIVTGTGPAAVLSMPALQGEATPNDFGRTGGTSYVRGATTLTLPVAPAFHVAQGAGSWVGVGASGNELRWSRFLCVRTSTFPATYSCGGTEYGRTGSAQSPSQVRAAMNRAGQCFVATWNEGTTRQALFQPLPTCPVVNPPAACFANTTMVPTPVTNGLRVAPFTTNGQNTLLAAWYSGFGFQLGLMTDPGACTNAFTQVGGVISVPNWPALDFEPVQVGQRPGLLYVDSTGVLRLAVP